jgi:hypothetical protein
MRFRFSLFSALFATVLSPSHAQTGGGFDLSWNTIDGGGANCSGGEFVVTGTIGQSDAQPAPSMSGGPFEISGGFIPVTQVCYCPGDMNGDGKRDGRDVQKFVACLIEGGSCSCADTDAANGVSLADVNGFVTNLIATAACP